MAGKKERLVRKALEGYLEYSYMSDRMGELDGLNYFLIVHESIVAEATVIDTVGEGDYATVHRRLGDNTEIIVPEDRAKWGTNS